MNFHTDNQFVKREYREAGVWMRDKITTNLFNGGLWFNNRRLSLLVFPIGSQSAVHRTFEAVDDINQI